MADSSNRGITAREAVERYCDYWTHAAYVGCWPQPCRRSPNAIDADATEASEAAAGKLFDMLKHELDGYQLAIAKRKARSRLRQKGLLPSTDEFSRKEMNEQVKNLRKRAKRKGIDLGVDGAVYRINMAENRDPDQSTGPDPVPLWATGHRGSAIDTPAILFTPEQWTVLTLDIEDNSVLDGDVKYVDLRIYDHKPAVAEDVVDTAPPKPEQDKSPPESMLKKMKENRVKPDTQERYIKWWKVAKNIRGNESIDREVLARQVASQVDVKWETVLRTLDRHFPGWSG